MEFDDCRRLRCLSLLAQPLCRNRLRCGWNPALPYNPQFGTDKKVTWQNLSQQVPPANPQFGRGEELAWWQKPAPGYRPPLSLPTTAGLSPFVRNALIGVALIVVLVVLVNFAFTPAELRGFWRWLDSMHLGDSRVVSFTLLGLLLFGVGAFTRHTIIQKYGSAAFGYGEAALGLALILMAIGGWRHGNIWLPVAGGMGWLGYIFIVWGWRNIQANQGQIVAPQVLPEMVPSHDTHSAGWATPQELNTVWDGRKSHSDEGTVWD